MTNALTDMPIPPEIYSQTLERLDLQTVCLEEVHSFCDRDVLEQGGVTISVEEETFARQTPTRYLAYIHYHLTGTQAATAALKLNARYCLIFDTDKPVPAGFFDVFRTLNLKMTTLPYFRELVASITGRMEVPTLTLPYNLFIPDDDPDVPAIEEGQSGALSSLDEPIKQ